MRAEIIAVGTELTTGAMLDTNSQWLSIELAAIGISVAFHSTVADDVEAMASVLRTAADRCDLIILTGGLGPTLDDLTRHALAAVLGTELVLDPQSLEFIRAIFARHNREMPERNSIQAYFPAGSEPIPNPRGTAPGIWAGIPRMGKSPCLFAALPGVPSEMKRMFAKEVVPRLPRAGQVIQRARVNCFGVGESKAEEMLGELTARGRDPEVGITVHEATITLRIVAQGRSAEECADKIAATKRAIYERMGELIFGEEDEQLQHVVVRLLETSGRTCATAEIGSGGLLARWLAATPGRENKFHGGVVASSEEILARGLVDSGLAGSPSAKTAVAAVTLPGDHADGRLRQFGERCRARFDADFALVVGEFPHYDPEDATKAAPQSQIGLYGEGISRTIEYTFLGDPTLNQSRAAKVALNLLRLHLLNSAR